MTNVEYEVISKEFNRFADVYTPFVSEQHRKDFREAWNVYLDSIGRTDEEFVEEIERRLDNLE